MRLSPRVILRSDLRKLPHRTANNEWRKRIHRTVHSCGLVNMRHGNQYPNVHLILLGSLLHKNVRWL